MSELSLEMDYTAGSLSGMARSLYVGGPVLMRKLQHWRPYICPFERLVEHVPVGASVLDVGCGCGLFLGLLAASGRKPRGVGFDVSGGAIDVAQAMAERAKAHGADLRFERRDATAAWPAGRFDVVDRKSVV